MMEKKSQSNFRKTRGSINLSRCKLEDVTNSQQQSRRSTWQRQRRTTDRGRQLDNNKLQYFNFIRLIELSKKDTEEITKTLIDKKNEFDELLCNFEEFSYNSPDLPAVTLEILDKICCTNSTEILMSLLSHACSTPFIKSLEFYITKLPFENPSDKIKNKIYHEDKDKFWFNLIRFFKKFIEVFPSKACDQLFSTLRKVIQVTDIIAMNQSYKINEKVEADAKELFRELDEKIKKIEDVNRSLINTLKKLNVDETPPENFKHLSVIPRLEDLHDERPFIRPCKVNDSYDSVEHYLDVQFRLLREDFISPLRTGLRDYLNINKSQTYRIKEVRIYRKVRLVVPERIDTHIGIKIFFGPMKHIDWINSKRLMQGGLVMLSNDYFRTVIFAIILCQKEKDLKKGFTVIEPCEGSVITGAMYKTDFVMLESRVYFEPYLAVLNALKGFSESNFPMETYLIHADASKKLPTYLLSKQSLEYKDLNLPIGNDSPWPSATKVGLDESQYQAFRCALTEELAIIQGPPGTGKTFIALEVVSTLLNNKSSWKHYGPIVVVCLTNHALDQFLEGILKYTRSVVRLGTRSKSEILKKFTLFERRKTNKKRKTVANSLMYSEKNRLEGVLSFMERVRVFLSYLSTPNVIVPLDCFTEFCQDETFDKMKFVSNKELINWLFDSDATWLLEDTSEMWSNLAETDDDDVSIDDLTIRYECSRYEPVHPLKRINNLISQINRQIINYRTSEICILPFNPLFDQLIHCEENLAVLVALRTFLQEEFNQHPILYHPLHPSTNPRWQLYWRWVDVSYDSALKRLSSMENYYHDAKNKYNKAKQLVDVEILNSYDIVGLTTTAAAKQQDALTALQAPIVIVEEAAEILETHVVCSLTKDTQHLILIGDHKQLRPKASVYKLGKDFNLNISLFERMVNIRDDCVQLQYQHRMSPQISKLITPAIYEKLYNHKSVYRYPKIKGIEKNLFFINHNHKDSFKDNGDSYMNEYEVKFLILFATHLLKQGYIPEEITILCTYSAQLFALKKESVSQPMLKGVVITTVDNYQGEENRIILLSLVRNNGEGNIGFLKEENRVCVALSRAREGLYIMGNIEDLVVKNNIWPKIKRVLETDNQIGDALELKCQIHEDQTILIKDINDFDKCPEGGCLKICNTGLSCGHSCTSVCHILDRQHEKYQCRENCTKRCPFNHPCPLQCYEPCESCKVKMNVTLPDCKHNIKKFCGVATENCRCSYLCRKLLSCGHTCILNCHVNYDPDHVEYKCHKKCNKNFSDCNHSCPKKCYEECGSCAAVVEKQRSCGHYYKNILCSANVEDLLCVRPCKRIIKACGHQCQLKCSEVCGNCQEKVKRVSTCGHIIELKCNEEATTSKCNGKCKKVLPCGHLCTKKCKDECSSICKCMVLQTEPGLCGHMFSVPCCYSIKNAPNSAELLKYCKEPCQAQLLCGHICQGSCGLCKQGRFHIPCTKPCDKFFICGHKCDQLCSKECQVCQKKCELKCPHTKCNKKCGTPCKQCMKPCGRKCEHKKCKKLCYELCDIEPCNESCKKLLKCGHPCVGFCGDPCPLLCRVCNKEELIEIFFGYEDEPDARFILLEDCNHCIESKGLMKWFMTSDGSIGMKTCPRCKTPIMKCMRMMNEIKNSMKDVQDVNKTIFFQKPIVLEQQQKQNLNVLHNIIRYPVVEAFPEMKHLLHKLNDQEIQVRRQKRQILNAQKIEAFGIVLNILNQMFDSLALISVQNINSFKFLKNQVALLVESIPTTGQISKQELNDIQLELRRFHYMVEMCKAEVEKKEMGVTLTNEKGYSTAMANLLSIKKFSETVETQVRIGLGILRKTNVEIERWTIVRDMQYSPGHWFKCPNGHLNTINDCNRARQRSRCKECGAVIGGE